MTQPMSESISPKHVPYKRYPWDVWSNGEVHNLIQGEDFSTSVQYFRMAARAWAERHNKNVVVKSVPLVDGEVMIKFNDKV